MMKSYTLHHCTRHPVPAPLPHPSLPPQPPFSISVFISHAYNMHALKCRFCVSAKTHAACPWLPYFAYYVSPQFHLLPCKGHNFSLLMTG